jgi:ribose 5-phosphate isomerase B
MKIALGSDHRGYQLKGRLDKALRELGHEVIDVGVADSHRVDYTDYAEVVSQKVAAGDVDRGILICGTGIGMAITANKFPGVRAATVHDELTAEMCRRHNDVNVLCLSGDMLGERPIDDMIDIWLKADGMPGAWTKFAPSRSVLRIRPATKRASLDPATRRSRPVAVPSDWRSRLTLSGALTWPVRFCQS